MKIFGIGSETTFQSKVKVKQLERIVCSALLTSSLLTSNLDTFTKSNNSSENLNKSIDAEKNSKRLTNSQQPPVNIKFLSSVASKLGLTNKI